MMANVISKRQYNKEGMPFYSICNLKADDDYYYSTEESVSDA
jgi:hypothetical protein